MVVGNDNTTLNNTGSVGDFEQQLINQLIVESPNLDQSLGAVLKTVLTAGRQNEFLTALSTFSSRKEKEIERVCHQNYQHFAQSTDELLTIRREAAELKNAARVVIEEVGQCGQLLYDTKVEIHETRKMMEHTQRLVLALEDCLKALNCAHETALEVADKNHGRALRLMERLQGDLLPRIESFSFSVQLQEWVPAQLEAIRGAALDELKTWLGVVRGQTPLLGEQAFNRAQKRIERWREMHRDITTPTAINASPIEEGRSAVAYAELIEMEREDAAAIIMSPPIKVDFAPLLQVVHLFDLMNRRAEFQVMFSEYRRAQAKVIFDLPVNVKEGEGKSFANFLHHVAGFFIMEYFLARKPQKFYSRAHVEGLWETAVRIINNYILESLGEHADQGVFMKIKWLQVFFLHAMEIYDIYSITTMLDTILSLFYRYVDLAKAERAQAIHAAAQSADLCRIEVTNPAAWARWQRQFTFLNDELVSLEGGNYLPFSSFVGDTFNNINDFINNFYVFLEGIPQQSSELDDIAKKTCDWFIEQAAKFGAEKLEMATHFDITSIIQILKDLECLRKIQPDIARILMAKEKSRRANAVQMFSDDAILKSIHLAQEHLFSRVGEELDSALKSTKYDVYLSVTPITPSRISDTFISHYHQTVSLLYEAHLDDSTIKQLKFSLFNHLADYIHELLKNDTTVAINLNFIIQLDLDLQAWAQLAESEDPLLMESFVELRQLITLMLVEQTHEYLDPIIRNRKYSNLRPSEIIPILQKLKEPITKKRNFEDMILLLS